MNWKNYNNSLVKRGEIFLPEEGIEQWIEELREMNEGKVGNSAIHKRVKQTDFDCSKKEGKRHGCYRLNRSYSIKARTI